MRNLCLILSGILSLSLFGATYYVDNVKGSDSNPGTCEKPFASIEKGIAALKTSDRLEVVNNPGKPYVRTYRGPVAHDYYVQVGGTPEKPLVINGNKAVISGLAVIPEDKWESVGGRIYSLPFWPMSNSYRYSGYDYWMPDLKIWFIDGKDAYNALSMDDLKKNPGGFWWSRKDKKVFFHLPAGKEFKDIKIQLPANSGFYACAPHTVIENFTIIHSWNDGFDTRGGGARNVLYRNCISVSNCGQGFSSHNASNVTYIDCGAFNCGSAGISNVDQSKSNYIRCVIARNSDEAGVRASLHDDCEINMIDSLIMENSPIDQVVSYNDCDVSLYNCVVMGRGKRDGVLTRCWDGTLNLFRCTLVNANEVVAFRNKDSKGIARLQNCLISNIRHVPRSSNRLQYINVLSLGESECNADVPAAQRGYGAEVPGSVWQMYYNYRNARAMPDGVDFNGRK